MDTEYRWFPHLEGAIPSAGQGKRISTYTVALEGWRRGLHLKFYSIFEDGNKLKVRYSLSSKSKTHYFSLSMGDRVSDEAFKICNDKDITKQYLEKYNVPVPKGEMFGEAVSEEEIIKYGLTIGFPIVVKPTDGNAGKGVFANITNEAEFREIVSYVRDDLAFSDIIVEKYVAGEEFRIYVIENRVLGAINRRPANVVGDGIHTIRELIHQKNEQRKNNPHLTSRLIKIDREIEILLEENNYMLNSIPSKNELVYLREKSNLSTGGEAVDVTNELTDELEKIAIDAGQAIPGLTHYGVDMIVSDNRKEGVILEVNTRPGLGGHLFPGEGTPRDLAREIIDFYFPETKGKFRSNLFFDFDSILEAVMSRSVDEVDLISPPLSPLYARRYTVQVREECLDKFRLYTRKLALKNEMHGHIEFLGNNQFDILLSTVNQKVLNKVMNSIRDKYEIELINEIAWDKPLLIGFETRSNTKLSRSEIRELVLQNQRLENENLRLTKRYTDIKSSRAWKITFPIRTTLHKIKTLLRGTKDDLNN